MANIVFGIISAIGCILGMVFGLVALFRNKRIDDSKEGKEDGIVLTELGYIKAGVDDLKRDNRDMRNEMQTMHDVMARLDESCKQAHKRIDKLEKYHQPN
jgi:hypothetical protein